MNVTLDNYLDVLIGRDYSISARVGVCQGGVYRSVCDVNWDLEDANATCNSLEFASEVGEYLFNLCMIELNTITNVLVVVYTLE